MREVAVSLEPVFDRRPELLPIFKQAGWGWWGGTHQRGERSLHCSVCAA